MLATSSTVDPLLTSPQRARQHNEDMAALQRLPPLQLPPSAATEETRISMESSAESSQRQRVNESRDREVDEQEEEEERDAETEFDQLMNRGNYLRQLRMLALADDAERQAERREFRSGAFCEEKKEDFDDDDDAASCDQESLLEDEFQVVPSTKDKILNYNSYLAHQRYYDDLKHIDMKYIDYGPLANWKGQEDGGKLVVKQHKPLGKGGICWDAAFMLGEHVISLEDEWNASESSARSAPPRVVELGAGTGICGMMVAKATNSHVILTDLPELAELMHDNIQLNFESTDDDDGSSSSSSTNDELQITTSTDKKAMGTITSRTLCWGVEADYQGTYDVIIGADIVTSLYDPVALAQTLHALSGPDTRIYLSGKARLDKPHEEFDAALDNLFENVRKVEPRSRLRSPNVFIIIAEGKKL